MNKKFWAIALAGLMTMSLAACASKTPEATEAPAPTEAPAEEAPAEEVAPAEEAPAEEAPAAEATGEKIYIPLISKGFQHQFWQAVKAGADKAAAELGVEITFEGPEAETEVAKQIDMLKDALSKKPAAICLAALDSTAVVPQLEECKANNIPVIGFDSGVDSDIPIATCATDNKAAAAAAADKMAELLGGKGEVFVIVHDQTSITGKDRRDGFVEQIEAKYPDIKIVGIDYGDGNADKSEQIVAAAIVANPDLKGVFGANEGSAIGAVNAVQKSGKKDLVLIGYDSGKIQMEAIRNGLMAGAISQDPVSIGYNAVKAAVAASKGETVEKMIDTGFKWYDKTNIDEPDIQAVLYE